MFGNGAQVLEVVVVVVLSDREHSQMLVCPDAAGSAGQAQSYGKEVCEAHLGAGGLAAGRPATSPPRLGEWPAGVCLVGPAGWWPGAELTVRVRYMLITHHIYM